MSNYRRWFVSGGTYFLTYNRQPILTTDQGRYLLRTSILESRRTRPFLIIATVLLPDHWHLLLKLPSGDNDYPIRIKRIKEHFSQEWLRLGLPEEPVTASQAGRGERGIWQPRFWEHTVRDEADLEGCADYIHWNPRKHNLVRRVKDWPWSSFHRFVDEGQYEIDWGGTAPASFPSQRDWGE